MSLVLLPFVATAFSLLLAVASLLRKRRSVATWCFSAGMAALGIDALFVGLSLSATQVADLVYWQTSSFIAKSLVPVFWLPFSLTYSRGDRREHLRRWRVPLALALVPLGLTLSFQAQLLQLVPVGPQGEVVLQFGPVARALNVILLVAAVLILMNLEQTYRSAVGTMRWRLKFVVLAMAVIFGARLYVRSQAILFSAPDLSLWSVESGGLLIGCVFLAIAYARTGLAEVDVYPSLAALRSSVTLLLVGAYLFIVGVLAQLVGRLGGVESFEFRAFVVLLGMAALGVLLLSDRIRQIIHSFVVRHFQVARHDSLRLWTLFSRRLADVRDETAVCVASAKLVAEAFDVLSITVWLVDAEKDQLVVGTSTAPQPTETVGCLGGAASSAVLSALRLRTAPFDLESVIEPWAEELRRLNPSTFPNGGNRWCVPLSAGDRSVGALLLADRVNASVYTQEELELLTCIADHVASALASLRLGNEVAQARELEAFQTMSAFFVHDLKNAAASLNLTLKNLPVHFDDPAFREDALRAIGNTARRVDDMIARLSALRQPANFRPVDADLNQLVTGAIEGLPEMRNVELTQDLQPLPTIRADRDQIQSLVTNLVLNARDATGVGGRIEVRTNHREGRVMLSVADNGCGMSPEFLKESLFRPFQSTKKQGLGIGMFQSKMAVERHGGSIQVESEAGKGTTFVVSFPVGAAS